MHPFWRSAPLYLQMVLRKYFHGPHPLREDHQYRGVLKWYYRNGILGEETIFRDGVKDGVKKLYCEDGKLQRETTYQNGALVSDCDVCKESAANDLS